MSTYLQAADPVATITQESLQATRYAYGQRLSKECTLSRMYTLFKVVFKANDLDMPYDFMDFLKRQKPEDLLEELNKKADHRSSKWIKAYCDCEVDFFNATITDEEFTSGIDEADTAEAISNKILTDQSFIDKKLACYNAKADQIDALKDK